MKKIFFFLIFASMAVQSQVKIGLWEPYYNGEAKKSVFFDGKSLKESSTDTDEHGAAVSFVLLQDMSNVIEIYHAGFKPTSRYLREAGILEMTVEEREKNLPSEYEYWQQFVKQTVSWFKKQKVRVVNMSFGNSAATFAENNPNLAHDEQKKLQAAQEWMRHFQQAFDEAFKSAPEILFIVAAGNDEMDMRESFDVPGLSDQPNVLCVGALSKDGKRKISNYADAVDIYVPAEDIEWVDSLRQKHCDSGTSLAVPQITKKAALLLNKNPKMKVADLKNALLK